MCLLARLVQGLGKRAEQEAASAGALLELDDKIEKGRAALSLVCY